MCSSRIRRERRLLFGPTKVEQHVVSGIDLREGGGKEVWITPCWILDRRQALINWARERAEKSRPRKRRRKRGQRAGKHRSRVGKTRRSAPVRPSDPKGVRATKRIERQRLFISSVTGKLSGMTRRLVEGRERNEHTRNAYRSVSKAYRSFVSLVAKWRDFPQPISFTHFFYLLHNEGPWTGEEDIFTSYGWTHLSDAVADSNIVLRMSTDVRPPESLSVSRRGNSTLRPPFCRRCGDRHAPGPCPATHERVRLHRGRPCDCPVSVPTVRGLCANCSLWVDGDLRGVPRLGSRRA